MIISESTVQAVAPEGHELPDTPRPSLSQMILLDAAIDNIEGAVSGLRGLRRSLLALRWTHETPEGTLFR